MMMMMNLIMNIVMMMINDDDGDDECYSNKGVGAGLCEEGGLTRGAIRLFSSGYG